MWKSNEPNRNRNFIIPRNRIIPCYLYKNFKRSTLLNFSHLHQLQLPRPTSCMLASRKKCFPHLRKPVTIGGEGGHRRRLYLAACFRVDSLNSASARAASWISKQFPPRCTKSLHFSLPVSSYIQLFIHPFDEIHRSTNNRGARSCTQSFILSLSKKSRLLKTGRESVIQYSNRVLR